MKEWFYTNVAYPVRGNRFRGVYLHFLPFVTARIYLSNWDGRGWRPGLDFRRKP